MSEEEIKNLKFDSLKIAEKEFESGVLPISINRPQPRKKKDKLSVIVEEKVSDEEIAAKEHEVEKEIVENPDEFSLVHDEETEDMETSSPEEQ